MAKKGSEVMKRRSIFVAFSPPRHAFYCRHAAIFFARLRLPSSSDVMPADASIFRHIHAIAFLHLFATSRHAHCQQRQARREKKAYSAQQQKTGERRRSVLTITTSGAAVRGGSQRRGEAGGVLRSEAGSEKTRTRQAQGREAQSARIK